MINWALMMALEADGDRTDGCAGGRALAAGAWRPPTNRADGVGRGPTHTYTGDAERREPS